MLPLLSPQAEPLDETPISLDILVSQVVEKPAALTHHHQKAPPAVMVFLMHLEVLRQVIDALREKSHLHLG